MRYQLPEGTASVSVLGMEFQADDDGQIDVPDGLPAEVYQALESPDHHNLKGVAEPVTSADIEAAGRDPQAEKRVLRDLLRHHGEKFDGRATIGWLRSRAIDVLQAVMAAAGKPVVVDPPKLEDPPAAEPSGATNDPAPTGDPAVTPAAANDAQPAIQV